MLSPISLLKIGLENLQTELSISDVNNFEYRNDLREYIQKYIKAIAELENIETKK